MNSSELRLNRFLAASGMCSRRAAEGLIASGRVRVNGRVRTDLGTRVDPHRDRVTLDGKRLVPASGRILIALNKPEGVITSMRDERGRKTVRDLLTGVRGRVFPVGRLDRDSEGLLLFTNDGALAHRLMHPSFGVEKVYSVSLSRAPVPAELETLRQGIELEDGLARVVSARRESEDGRTVELSLREGKKREIRRIFAELGIQVLCLKRTRFGPIRLGGLARGAWRNLNREEVEGLLAAVKPHPRS